MLYNTHLRIFLLCSIVAGACAGPAATRPASEQAVAIPVTPPLEAAKDKRPPAGRVALLRELPDGRRVLVRSDLRRLLKEGAQHFISLVRVRPSFVRGRFRGWRIIGYRGPGKLEFGDVVTRVNDASIERPAQFMQVWNEIAEKPYLTVELLRNGKPLIYRWPIIDIAASAPSS